MAIFYIITTPEFDSWYNQLTTKTQAQIDSRLYRIKEVAYFGDCKNVGAHLSELRWRNGRRIYFSRVGQYTIKLLLGGHKNAQKKDIKTATLLLQRYAHC